MQYKFQMPILIKASNSEYALWHFILIMYKDEWQKGRGYSDKTV